MAPVCWHSFTLLKFRGHEQKHSRYWSCKTQQGKEKIGKKKKPHYYSSLITACSHNWKQQKTTAHKDSFNLLQLILKYVRHCWSQSHILKLCLKWTKKKSRTQLLPWSSTFMSFTSFMDLIKSGHCLSCVWVIERPVTGLFIAFLVHTWIGHFLPTTGITATEEKTFKLTMFLR